VVILFADELFPTTTSILVLEGPTDGKRAFFMGNALVIGIISKLGNELSK
jgi:hypothetical protein